MELEPIWYRYATFDNDGYVNGITEDAPEEAKRAYQEYMDEIREYIDNGAYRPR